MSQIYLKIIKNHRKDVMSKDQRNKTKYKLKIKQTNKLNKKRKGMKSNYRINRHRKMIKINLKNKFLKQI